ncbi:MAG TPA: hypothetical protein PKC39_15880 [Ferruginibacter sp.]|nr:hypothetical protein [Ferruginibacter sp.]HMP22439.1 hypothetical protein [Ferruginibacter sp.]
MHKYWWSLTVLILLVQPAVLAQSKKKPAYGTVKIAFTNTVGASPLVLHDSTYSNAWNEQYTVTKFKYYISNIILHGSRMAKAGNSYFLINQADSNSHTLSIRMPAGTYNSIRFLPGVDSSRNCSGAQTGALDPLNDMFWTWNSGYVMQKLEGFSTQSNFRNHKIEYHIGGYKGEHHVLRPVELAFEDNAKLVVKQGYTSTIYIRANLDKIWQGPYTLKIADTPLCTSPGAMAKSIAGNFAGIFSITGIINPAD